MIVTRTSSHNNFRPYQGTNTDTTYQCLSLRQRLLATCTAGLNIITDITCSLVEQYQLNIELDDKHTYLAYRDISVDSELSLESLKVLHLILVLYIKYNRASVIYCQY